MRECGGLGLYWWQLFREVSIELACTKIFSMQNQQLLDCAEHVSCAWLRHDDTATARWTAPAAVTRPHPAGSTSWQVSLTIS